MTYGEGNYAESGFGFGVSQAPEATPANIIATAISVTPSGTPCITGICTLLVSVTWANSGELTGSSNLSITTSSGTVTPPIYYAVELVAGAQTTLIFIVSDMAIGTCSVCPNPN